MQELFAVVLQLLQRFLAACGCVQRTAVVRMCSLTLQHLQLVVFWMASGCVQRTLVRMCSLTLQQLQLVLICIACGCVQRAARAAHYQR